MSAKEEEEEDDRLPLGLYLKWVKNQLDSEYACLELPLTLLLLIAFSCLSYLHLKQADVFVVQGALKFDIEENANFAWTLNFGHKTIFDVNSIPDVWSWVRIGFMPLVVQHSWGFSESLQDGYDFAKPAGAAAPFNSSNLPGSYPMEALGQAGIPIRDDFLHHNRIIGGIRVRQERSSIGWDLCRLPPNVPESLWKEWLGKPCVPAPSYDLMPESDDADIFGTEERVEWLITSMHSLPHMQRQLVDMEDGCSFLEEKKPINPPAAGAEPAGGDGTCLCSTCTEGGVTTPWLDEQTQRMEIAFVVYNFEYGLYSLVGVNFFFNRGGMIYKLVNIQSSWASSFSGNFWTVAFMVLCDLTWVIALTYIMIAEVQEIINVVRSSKDSWWSSIWNDYMAFWNTVDWISIMAAYFVVACWLRLFFATGEVNADFEGITALNTTSISDREFSASIEGFMTSVEDMCEHERLFRLSFVIYPMVVMLRLFKSFDAQPRLAVVTQTLVVATQDMLHFFIIFFACYICMTVNAVLLFGQDYEAFATFARSTINCFRVLFGDWDYERMREVGLLNCAIWFWMFQLILFLILLNILLAILMDSYAEVQSHAANKLSLPAQISEMVRRYRMTTRGQRVRLNDIWDAFFKAIGDEKDMLTYEPCLGYAPGVGGRELIRPKDVIERVAKYMKLKVPMSQAKRGLKSAKSEKEAKEHTPYTFEDVHQQMIRLGTLAHDVREQVQLSASVIKQNDFDEEDEEFMQRVPEKPVGNMTEQRQLVANAVSNVVGALAGEISGTLGKEAETFVKRQQLLEHAQVEMVACAKDASATLEKLRGSTDEVVSLLQTHSLRRQRWTAQQASSASGIAVAVLQNLAGCGAPERAPPAQI